MSIAGRSGAVPSLPATLIGDMAGGAMFLAFGLVCALLEAKGSGRGQMVDAAMVDGVSTLTGLVHSLRSSSNWPDKPEQNFFLHSSPFYDCYECADGKHITLGAIEPQFYNELLQRLDLEDVAPADQHDSRQWPALKARVAVRIKSRTREEWCGLLEGTDVCFAPVLSLDEAAQHPHQRARGNFIAVEGHLQPSPSPRFSRSTPRPPQAGTPAGEHTREILGELGFTDDQIDALS